MKTSPKMGSIISPSFSDTKLFLTFMYEFRTTKTNRNYYKSYKRPETIDFEMWQGWHYVGKVKIESSFYQQRTLKSIKINLTPFKCK